MSRSPTHLEIPSPCTGVCTLDPVTGLCRGCLRNTVEIAEWPTAGTARRLAILGELRRRRGTAGRSGTARRPRRRGVR